MKEKISVMISDCADPDYYENANRLFLNIEREKLNKTLSELLQICANSNLCLNINFDYTSEEE